MREFQEKQNIRKKLYSKPVLIGLLILCILVFRGLLGIYVKEKESRMEVERLEKRKMDLEARLLNVTQNAAAIQTDAGIEAEIRNRYDVVKEGEQVIVLVDKELPPPPEEKKNFLEKFWDSVTGVFKKDDKKDGEVDTDQNTDKDKGSQEIPQKNMKNMKNENTSTSENG